MYVSLVKVLKCFQIMLWYSFVEKQARWSYKWLNLTISVWSLKWMPLRYVTIFIALQTHSQTKPNAGPVNQLVLVGQQIKKNHQCWTLLCVPPKACCVSGMPRVSKVVCRMQSMCNIHLGKKIFNIFDTLLHKDNFDVLL